MRNLLPPLLLSSLLVLPVSAHASSAEAIFAGGCFWCMEEAFEQVEGVEEAVSGYIGGHLDNPTYYQVSQGQSGHTEAVQVSYDPDKISYNQLLDVFWTNIDPVDGGGQFCDRGSQYRSEIFYRTQEEKLLAEASKLKLTQADTLPSEIETDVTQASEFFVAEEYHQDYYRKNPVRYSFYKYSCGRAKRLEQLWGKAP
ncbi:peptide-methionine (S)-S-oxide reductase MsrA [Motiliproteus sediminis]|uniref:peptide-methionine (S)-S-oxide reductase MsrA n=1 Tax=Motiliproteus sediminis TaxID=1468178 RepID=UPI001AEFC139|nr:peptide-methionine (S)-S-oxide reductase MsrA [Motiliproteus sediminis]